MRRKAPWETPSAMVGSTDGPRFLKWLPGALLLCVLAAGLALTAIDPAAFTAPKNANLVNGECAAGWQKSYEQGLQGREAAVAAWAAMRYTLFTEGEPGVLVGRDGWLYSNEEFFPLDPTGRALEAALANIAEVRDALASRNIVLVVAMVPTKAVVCAEHLGRYRLPASLRDRYGAVRRAISSLGVAVPDLMAPLREAASRGEVFLRTDTHWTADGASVAAQALAQVVRPELDARGSPRTLYRTEKGKPQERRGDLLNFLPLGRLGAAWGPAPDLVAEVVTVAETGSGTGLFGALEIPVALVGRATAQQARGTSTAP